MGKLKTCILCDCVQFWREESHYTLLPFVGNFKSERNKKQTMWITKKIDDLQHNEFLEKIGIVHLSEKSLEKQ